MKVPFVDLAAGARPDRDAYIAAMTAVIDSGGFVGGAAVTDFEAAFARHVGVDHAIAVGTGTDALLLALRAMGVGAGDEVITAANSFYATGEAIALAGATPVLADVDDATLLLDADDAARRVTKRTKVIIPVHLFGQVANMAPVLALAGAHGLQVLEDSAQAHGATRVGADGSTWKAGAVGAAGAFSFYPTKNLGAFGEGGAITTSDAGIAERVRVLRDHGQTARHHTSRSATTRGSTRSAARACRSASRGSTSATLPDARWRRRIASGSRRCRGCGWWPRPAGRRRSTT